MVRLKAQGLSNGDIAERMGIKANYVYISLKKAFNRLGVRSAREALAAMEYDTKPTLPLELEEQQTTHPSREILPKPIKPLLFEHVRLLRLLSAGLTIYEVAIHLEIEPEHAETLRRQAYLWLGVTNLKDAITVSGIEIPEEKLIRPRPVRRPKRMGKDETRKWMLDIIGSALEDLVAVQGGANPSTDGDCWPDYLWILQYPELGAHFCIATPDKVIGLVCFSSGYIVEVFFKALSDRPEYAEGCTQVEVSFNEAMEIARAREDVQALILLDDPDNLRLHYVR